MCGGVREKGNGSQQEESAVVSLKQGRRVDAGDTSLMSIDRGGPSLRAKKVAFLVYVDQCSDGCC